MFSFLEYRRRMAVLRLCRGRLLDVGCGENRLVRQYGNGIGVDVFDWGDVDLIVHDSAQLPFPDHAFDTISFVACLNHIPNREAALREAHRLLHPQGRVIITMISPHLGLACHKVFAPWDLDQNLRGVKRGEEWGLTTAHVKKLLHDAGFYLVTHTRFVLWLNNLYVAAKTSLSD